MKKSQSVIKRDSKVISPSLTRDLDIVFERGDNCNIWDIDGKKYLDFTASVAVNSVGHANKEVQKAITKQMKKGNHCCFSDFYAQKPVELAEKLLALMPNFDKVFFSNSGTESTEAAYKMARWHTNKTWVIAFDGCFHGRTMGSLSMTNSKPIQRDRYSPFLPIVHVPYPYAHKLQMSEDDSTDHCLSELEDKVRAMQNDLAAVFIEPILGEGGYVVPQKRFMKGMYKICEDYGILLGSDEVQSGCFRTGRFLAMENFEIEADITWLSKALGGGLPLGATIAKKGIMDWPAGSHANTFGGNLLGSAAAVAVLDIMKKKKLGENAVKVGEYFKKRFNENLGEVILEVRGLGLMIGLEIVDSQTRDKIIQECAREGLILLPAGNSVIRICPPLTITKEEAEKGIRVIEKIIRKIKIRF